MIPWWEPVSIPLPGGLRIHALGFFIALGILAATLLGRHRAKALGIPPDHAWNLALIGIFAGVLGARLGAVVYTPRLFLEDPVALLRPGTGFSSFGGLGAAVAGGWLYVRWRGISAWVWGDMTAISALFGWSIGRIGCFLVHDHPGPLLGGPLSVAYPGGARLDLGLAEVLVDGVLVGLLLWWLRKPRPVGRVSGLALMGYGAARFGLDGLRQLDPRLAGLAPGQWAGLAALVLGAAIFVIRSRAPTDPVLVHYADEHARIRDRAWLAAGAGEDPG